MNPTWRLKLTAQPTVMWVLVGLMLEVATMLTTPWVQPQFYGVVCTSAATSHPGNSNSQSFHQHSIDHCMPCAGLGTPPPQALALIPSTAQADRPLPFQANALLLHTARAALPAHGPLWLD